MEVFFYAASGVIPVFVSICPCAELSGAVTDPCVYVSITRGWRGLYALGDLWKKSLPFTPEHPLETTSDFRPEVRGVEGWSRVHLARPHLGT